jgi:hypothetical protein
VVENTTHGINVLETIAARGLGTVDSLQVKDLKAVLQHDDLKAPEVKGNKAELMDRVLALANVNQAAAEIAAVAAERATLVPTVPAETEQAPCPAASAAIHPTMTAPATSKPPTDLWVPCRRVTRKGHHWESNPAPPCPESCAVTKYRAEKSVSIGDISHIYTPVLPEQRAPAVHPLLAR